MTQYSAGAVWWGLPNFGEGDTKKYFVLLTDEAEGELFLTAMTTSRGDKRYGMGARSASPCGCPASDFFRIEARQETCFPVTTWVQFDNAYEIGRTKLEDLVRQGRAGFEHMLSAERTRSMLNCAKRSLDIAKRDLERIDRALKARNPASKTSVRAAVLPAPPTDPQLEAARLRRGLYCGNCRSELDGLLKIDDLEMILQGKRQVPDGFFDTIETGFELIGAGCHSCSTSI